MEDQRMRIFNDYWRDAGIQLPDDFDFVKKGRLESGRFVIRYICGEADGTPYLEYYATHAMTNDQRVRIYADGRKEGLETIEEAFFYESPTRGDEERAEAEYIAHTRKVCEELVRIRLMDEDVL